MSRLNKINEISNEAIDFIKKFTPKEGISFIDNAEIANENSDFDWDELNELPTVSVVSKHGFYEEFVCIRLKVDKKSKNVVAVLYGKGENTGEIEEKFVDEFLQIEICEIADVLEEKIVVDED